MGSDASAGVEPGQGGRPKTPGPIAPSRRAFSTLVMSGAGLAALAACTQEAARPSPTVAVPPSPSASAAPDAASPSTAEVPGTAAPEPSPAPDAAPAPVTETPEGSAPGAALPGGQHSLTDPASPWVVVNKHRPLSPAGYVPADLVRPSVRSAASGEAALLNSTTAAAVERLFGAAAAEGAVLVLASGYRSFSTQAATYDRYVKSVGQAEADTVSARPGYSEHQTGFALDIGDGGGACSFQPCFADQPAAVWARTNGHRFGFIVRYPWLQHGTTGYYYEPWHLRYIGVEAATDMHNRGIATLEEYFGLEAAPAYR